MSRGGVLVASGKSCACNKMAAHRAVPGRPSADLFHTETELFSSKNGGPSHHLFEMRVLPRPSHRPRRDELMRGQPTRISLLVEQPSRDELMKEQPGREELTAE